MNLRCDLKDKGGDCLIMSIFGKMFNNKKIKRRTQNGYILHQFDTFQGPIILSQFTLKPLSIPHIQL